MTPTFELTAKQREATRLLAGPATHILLRGGSRSGKTFLLVRAIVVRAARAPQSRHAIFRKAFNHVKHSVIFDTFPKVMALCFPQLPYSLNKTDWFVDLPNGSQILFDGLDEKDRTEKILGLEFSTVFLNECSQIGYDARNKLITRLAQNSGLALKAYYDCNPPSTGSWLYRLFEKRVEPNSGAALADPQGYATLQLNPTDNLGNLPAEYLAELERLPEKDRRRFLLGEWLPQVEGALWTLDLIDQNRMAPAQMPDLARLVVAVDPSGCSGPEDTRSDEIGIVVTGRDREGRGYVLEDASGRYSPEGWAKRALAAFDRWKADRIVAERNFGGALVESNIRAVRMNAPVQLVTASRGKVQRAEPVAGLYEQRRVVHVGTFSELEDQLCNFSAAGYEGSRSPDRADAMIWGMSELLVEAQSRTVVHKLGY